VRSDPKGRVSKRNRSVQHLAQTISAMLAKITAVTTVQRHFPQLAQFQNTCIEITYNFN
jgi:hypothetical protein